MIVELLELTGCNYLFFCRIFARSVGDRCLLCDFHTPVLSARVFFGVQTDLRDFCNLPPLSV